jgi:hypothetical protein
MNVTSLIKLKITEILFKKKNFRNSIAQEISNNGFIVLHDFISADDCKALEEKANKIFSIEDKNIRIHSNGFDKRLFGIEFYDKNFRLEKVENISSTNFSELTKIKEFGYTYMLNKITAGKGNLGSGEGWHRDSPFFPQYKAILYLTDVSELNGPFQYIPETNSINSFLRVSQILKCKLNNYRFSDEHIEKLMKNGFFIKTFTARKGTLILADTRGIHRGSIIENGYRIALTRYNFYRQPSKSLALSKVNRP